MPHREPTRDPVRDLLDEESIAKEISKAIEGNDCPADSELRAYLGKELREPERIEVKSHLSYCGRCKKRVSELAQDRPPAPEPVAPSVVRRGFQVLRNSLHLGGSRSRALWTLGPWAAAGALVLGVAVFFLWPGKDFPYGGRIVHAQGKNRVRIGDDIVYEISTPRPLYLIEITIDGKGRIACRIPTGPRQGWFENGDRLAIPSRIPGDFDLYLVPCPVKEGYPNRLLNGLLEFLKTETALSRQNQRTGVEAALDLYRAEPLHLVLRIDP